LAVLAKELTEVVKCPSKVLVLFYAAGRDRPP
jgi:hypothetical protein